MAAQLFHEIRVPSLRSWWSLTVAREVFPKNPLMESRTVRGCVGEDVFTQHLSPDSLPDTELHLLVPLHAAGDEGGS